MTLIFQLDLDIVKMYYHTKNEVSMSTGSKVIARTHTHTQRLTHTHTHYENITSTAYAGGKNIGHMDLIFHVHIPGADVHTCAKNQVSMNKPLWPG